MGTGGLPGAPQPTAGDASDHDDDAEMEASRAPLLDHLLELRTRLIVALVAIVVGFAACFGFAEQIYNILLQPFQRAAALSGDENLESLRLIFTSPLEFFFAKLRLALFGGFIVAFPMVAYQVYAFIAPGLYRNEKAAFAPYLIASPALFALGGALVYFFILPLVLQFALGQQQAADSGRVAIELLPRVADYLALVTTLILAFGLAFQMPVALTLMARVGLITSDTLIKYWRYAVVGIFLVAAFLTPPDPMSQIGLGVAVLALYGISILAVKLIERRRAEEEAAAAE